MQLLRSLCVFCIVGVLAACSDAPATSEPATSAAQVAEPTQVVAADDTAGIPDNIVASVNGIEIDRMTFERQRQRFAPGVTGDVALNEQILETLIEQELINQGAAALNVTISQEAIQTEIDTLKAAAGSEESWQTWLSQNNMTESELPLVQRETLLTQGVRNALLQPYLGPVAQVQARHILLDDEATARAVLDQLAAGGDFVALAAEFSEDTTTRETGGDLGWFTAVELVDSDLADLAFRLDVGLIAGPVESRLGWHIIQVLDKAQREIEVERLPLLQVNIFNTWLAQQYNNAQIERNL